MNSEIAQEVQRINQIVSTVTGRDIMSPVREHKNVMARSIFCKIVYDYLKKSGVSRGAKSYIGVVLKKNHATVLYSCLLYTSPSPRDGLLSRMPSSA